MNWDNLFQIIVLVASGGALNIAIRAVVDRKKIRVDGVAVLSDTALKQAESAMRQASAAQREVEDLRDDIVKLRASIYKHDAWDRKVMRDMEKCGTPFEPPPEIWII